MQYRRLDPESGIVNHIHELRAQIRSNNDAPTGDVGVRGTFEATDPETGVSTVLGIRPDGTVGLQQWVNDVTPPNQPSAPSGEPAVGGVTITWDGKEQGGTAQPEDYDRTEVEYSENGTIWSVGGTIYSATSYLVPGLTVGTPYNFRLISYDKNGNASTPSTTITATPIAMTDNPDLSIAIQDLRDKDTELTTGVTDATQAASDAADDALEAFNKAKSVPTTFYGPTRPAVDAERPFVVGDTWYDTDDNNKVYVWDGQDFILSIDPRIEENNAALIDLTEPGGILDSMQNDLDSKITTYYGPAPATKDVGDLWLDATDPTNQILKRWDGNAWVVFDNPRVQEAYNTANTAQTTADKKIQTFTGTVAPANNEANDLGVGDLWIDTTAGSGKISRWMGTTTGWQEVVDNGTAAANKALADLGLNEQWKQDIESQADRAIATFYGPDSPTGMQIGDIWLSGVAGTPMKRWDGDSWETFEDPNVAAAYGRAGEALTAADTKIITYAQTTQPTGLTSPSNDGDLWINTSTGADKGKISRFANNAWTLVTDNGEAAASNALSALGLDQTFVDKVENLEDKAITTFYGPDTPVSPKEGDLWLTGNGIEPMKRWTNGAWVKFENPAVEAAYNTAGDAEALADKKIVTYAQTAAPVGTLELPLRTGDLWIDTDDSNKLYRFVEGSGAGTGWIAIRDTGIAAAQDTANTAIKATAFSGNPSFDDWTSTVPNGYVTYTTAPTKETTTVRIPKNGARWSITTTAQQAGLQFAGGVVGGHLPNLEYYTVELEFYLVSGTLSGAGVILDWNGTSMTNNRATINLGTELPTVNTGKWYRVTKTVRRPTNMTGTWSSMGGFLMANWSGVGGAIKNIIFDWFNVRPATAEEITAYGVPATVQTLTNSIDAKGKVIIQSAVPSTLDRLPQNLWIDTTPIGNPAAPGNVPKRWNATTSQWEAVTEKAVIDAAAAAAKANEDASTAINDADLAYQAAGERSRIVHLNTTPPTPTDGWKDGDVWYKHTTVDITSPVIDWYIWNNNGWQLQALDETFLPLVNIATGTYGFLKGTQLEANSISVEKLIVGSLDNLIEEPTFDAGGVNWLTEVTAPYRTIDATAGLDGTAALKITGYSTGFAVAPNQARIKVSHPVSYRLSITFKSSVQLPVGSVSLEGKLYPGATNPGDMVFTSNTSIIPANTWTTLTGTKTVPETAREIVFEAAFASMGASAVVTIDSVSMVRAVDGTLIVDGALTGKTITGALIQSTTEANRGIKITGSQFVAYTDTGAETLRLDGTNAILTGAVIRTAASGARTQIDSTGIHSWNTDGFEHFSVTATGVTMTGVVEAKGNTHPLYNNAEPISTFIGNVAIKEMATGVTNYIPGIEWELARVGAMNSNPSVTSYAGTDLWITSGVNPANDYAQLHLDSGTGKAILTGINGITLDPRKGFVDTAGDIRAHQLKATGGSTTGRAVIHLASDTLAGTWFSIDGGVGGDEPAIWADTVRNLNVRAGTSSYINFVSNMAFKGIAMGHAGSAGISYANGWSDFGVGYASLRTILTAEGTVAITGMPKPGTRTDGIVMGYVDPAVRPASHQYVQCTVRAGSSQFAGMLSIRTDGSIQVYAGGNHASMSYLAIGAVYHLG